MHCCNAKSAGVRYSGILRPKPAFSKYLKISNPIKTVQRLNKPCQDHSKTSKFEVSTPQISGHLRDETAEKWDQDHSTLLYH
jgi:hypothetical protein